MHNACIFIYVYIVHYGTTDYIMRYSVFIQLSESVCYYFGSDAAVNLQSN